MFGISYRSASESSQFVQAGEEPVFGRFQEFHISRHIFQMLQLEPRCNCLWHDTRLQPQSLHHSFRGAETGKLWETWQSGIAWRCGVVAYLAFVLAFALADSSNELFTCDLSYTLNCCLDVELSNKGAICAGSSTTSPRNLALIVKRQGSSRDKPMSKRGTEYEHWVWRCLFTIFAGTKFKHLAY